MRFYSAVKHGANIGGEGNKGNQHGDTAKNFFDRHDQFLCGAMAREISALH